MIIRKCDMGLHAAGVQLTGLADSPVSRVLVVDNRIKSTRGIVLDSANKDVLVAGNLVFDCEHAGIQIENPLPATQRVLLANNSVVGNGVALRIWCEGEEGNLAKTQVECRGNLFIRSRYGDVVYYHQGPGTPDGKAKDSRMFLDFWQFSHNFRDQSGLEAKRAAMPLANDDRELRFAWFMSHSDADDPDFLRPRVDFPLAKGGAGGDLPTYVGALPPEGVEARDWQKTWKARMRTSTQKK
jgi:hypothetical protein